MSISTEDSDFIKKRSTMVRFWPWAGGALLLLIAVLAAWLWFSVPLMINPWSVFEGIEAGSIPDSTLTMMAAMLPLVVMTLLVSGAAVLLILFSAFSNERRLIGIIRQLQAGE